MYRPNGAIKALEGGGWLEHLAQDEADDRPRLGAHDDAVDQSLADARQVVARLIRRKTVGVRRRVLRAGEDVADRRSDEIGAGRPEPVLAAEMIGDRGDVRPGPGRNLARRRGLKTLRAEEVET